ncbi:cytochrome bd-I ubiquinol oxidase subunit 1 apoprotein [Terribacillus saccharophilus]|uniref:Cytochrome D ubiquinol oxidase subunit I n=1 Tax=Terribacillus saccharophilus TaxID=361277 RepID=A0A075LP69_9BACI|nr:MULTISPECIES: cytochrome ubiquinol oxidase subunit I [Terribacillus]AIF66233.1 cytochrome D ubiquinol oxidase subunit I [Terribacillus goriensis]MCM3225073.1 cytochrome ubiquinol oxidase subunit I [Terribacillus saccharophilus]SEM78861.1 cytochrome bd-I ubiquinol oxidase subunit 1 apoprotein [Terribacillus saccharophilus]
MFAYDSVILARMLTSMTLVFHIIFATIGVGVPLLISAAEYVGIRKRDPSYILLARRWTRGFVIIVAVGVVTGTAIGLQLFLLWPTFMQIAGHVISLPLFMETFAFFFEAIFLGAYIYTWDRFKGRYTHWYLSLPVIIGGGLSAVFITSVNAFMNTPQGFTLAGRTITSVEPLKAILNPATPSKVFHVLTSSYMTCGAILAALTAFFILKYGNNNYYKKALKLTMIVTLVFSIFTAIAGDTSAKFLASYQPEKLAAAEWHFETEKGADLILFGRLTDDNEIKGAIHLPKILSFLSFGDFNSEVTGLDKVDADLIPPLWIHYMFDLMVTLGAYSIMISMLFLVFMFWKKRDQYNKWLLRAIVVNAPFAMLALEFGWIFAEVGRQPWIMRGYLRVAEGAVSSPYVHYAFAMFLVLYVLLGTFVTLILVRLYKKNPIQKEWEQRFPDTLFGGDQR